MINENISQIKYFLVFPNFPNKYLFCLVSNFTYIENTDIRNAVPVTDVPIVRIQTGESEWSLNSAQLNDFMTDGLWLDNVQIDFVMEYLRSKHDTTTANSIVVTGSYHVYLQAGKWIYASDAGLGESIYLNEDENLQLIHPLLLENHWVLLHLDTKSKTATIFDSLFQNKKKQQVRSSLKMIEDYVLPAFIRDPQKRIHWKVRHFVTMPLQKDAESCGLYLLRAADEILECCSVNVEIREINAPLENRKYWVREMVDSVPTEKGRLFLEQVANWEGELCNLIKQEAAKIQTEYNKRIKEKKSAALRKQPSF